MYHPDSLSSIFIEDKTGRQEDRKTGRQEDRKTGKSCTSFLVFVFLGLYLVFLL